MSDFIMVCMRSLSESADGLDSMRNLKWSGMRDIATELGASVVPRSRAMMSNLCANLWIDRSTP